MEYIDIEKNPQKSCSSCVIDKPLAFSSEDNHKIKKEKKQSLMCKKNICIGTVLILFFLFLFFI